MIVADTMVWADHFGRPNLHLSAMLERRQICMHPFVRGELAMGNLPRRHAILADLDEMPQASLAEHHEVMGLIESARLFGTGIGYVDAHLIASVLLTDGARLWTRDKRLAAVAERLGIGYAVG